MDFSEHIPAYQQAISIYESETGKSLERLSLDKKVKALSEHHSTKDLVKNFQEGINKGMISLISGALALK